MTAPGLPTGFESITPEWLTAVLHNGGNLHDSSVVSVTASLIGVGKGFAGQIARIQLTYDVHEDNAPTSLVAKLPPPILFDDPNPDMVLGIGQCFADEIRFYRDLSHQVPMNTAAYYYGDVDRATGHAILCIEDVQNVETGDILEGASAQQTRIAIQDAAGLHAAFWNGKDSEAVSWVSLMEDELEWKVRVYQERWPKYLMNHAGHCPGFIREFGSKLADNAAAVLRQLYAAPLTLVHGDYHLYNMLFCPSDDSTRMVVIDWQRPERGPAVWDLAYFLTVCVDTETRRQSEKALLEEYLSLLTLNGVADYSLAECQAHYRLALVRAFMRAVIDAALIDFSQPAAQEIRAVVFPRRTAILEDNDVYRIFD